MVLWPAKLATDNVFRLELANGSRVLASLDSESIRVSLSIPGSLPMKQRNWTAIMAAYIRCDPASQRTFRDVVDGGDTDPFWSVWDNDDPWTRIRATIDLSPTIARDALERARRQLSR